MSDQFNPVIIIPCYKHIELLLAHIETLKQFKLPIIIVDDCNPLEEANKLKSLDCEQIKIIRNKINLGKGGAMEVGFRHAYASSYTHALQIDADFQQSIDEIPNFIQYAREQTSLLICGKPIYHNVPTHRYIARYITHFWVSLELGIAKIIDSMCGIRVYPLEPVCKLMDCRNIGKRMSFDTEILVRLYWMGVDFKFYDVEVSYPKDGISTFAPFKDNFQISLMHTKLCIEKILHYFKIRKREYL